MTKTYLLVVLGLLVVSPVPILRAAPPLFETDKPLSMVLELPLMDLLRRAQSKPTVAGSLRYTDSDGAVIELKVEVTTRGKSRLEHCSLPPLSIYLKQPQVESTIFAGQAKLKLVTQCRGRSVYRRYLMQEYAIYRTYNLLTKYSFQVRMLQVTYRDSGGRSDKNMVQPAFFIESREAVAERHAMRTIDANRVYIRQLDPRQLSLLSLFQYLVGNTDWSARKGPGTERCCHNGKVIAPVDSDEGWLVLPYDFDQSGIINTSYSAPSDLLSIKSVRQRLYRGFCASNTQLDSTIATFNERRVVIEELFGNASDVSSANKSARKYVQGFYKIINDPKKRKKKIVDACQGTKQHRKVSGNHSYRPKTH